MPKSNGKPSRSRLFSGLFGSKKAEMPDTPESPELAVEVSQFTAEQHRLLSNVERDFKSNTGQAISHFESVIPQITHYLDSPLLSESARDNLLILQKRLMEALVVLTKKDASIRTAIHKFIQEIGGVDASVNIQFPAELNFEGRINFVNEKLETIEHYLELNTTNDSLTPNLEIIKLKLQREKEVLAESSLEQEQLKGKLHETEAKLEKAQKHPTAEASADSELPKRPAHPLFGGGGLPNKTEDGGKEAFLARIGAAPMAMTGLLGGLQNKTLKKAEEDPIDKAIREAKAEGRDLIAAALSAAEKANSNTTVAIAKGGKAAGIKEIEVVQRVIELLEEKDPDITEKKLIKEATAIATEVGFNAVTAGIMVKQAIREKRKAAGDYEEVTGARQDTNIPPPTEQREESDLEKRLRQRRMKTELQEAKNRPNSDSENTPPGNSPESP